MKTPFLGVSYWSEVAVWKVIFIIYKSQEHLDELPVVDLAVPVAVRGADHLVHLLITQVLAQVHQHLPGDTNLRFEYLLELQTKVHTKVHEPFSAILAYFQIMRREFCVFCVEPSPQFGSHLRGRPPNTIRSSQLTHS